MSEIVQNLPKPTVSNPTLPTENIKTWKNALLGSSIATGYALLLSVLWLWVVNQLNNSFLVEGMMSLILGPLVLLLGFGLFVLWIITSRILLKKLGWTSPGTALLISFNIGSYFLPILFPSSISLMASVMLASIFILLLAFYFLYYPVKRFQWLLNISLFLFITQLWGTAVSTMVDNKIADIHAEQFASFPAPLYFSDKNTPRSIVVSQLEFNYENKAIKSFEISNKFTTFHGDLEVHEVPVNKPGPMRTCDLLKALNGNLDSGTNDYPCKLIGYVKPGQPIYTNDAHELYTVFDEKTLVLFRMPNYPRNKNAPSLKDELDFLKTFHRVTPQELSKILQENSKINPRD